MFIEVNEAISLRFWQHKEHRVLICGFKRKIAKNSIESSIKRDGGNIELE